MDWQSAAVVRDIGDMVKENPSAENKSLHRLCFSQARTISHLIGETATLHSNILLRRRDACISLLPKQATDGMKKDLRTSQLDLSANNLFDDKVVADIVEELPKVATTEKLLSCSDSKSFYWRQPTSQQSSYRNDSRQSGTAYHGRISFRNRKDTKTRPKSSNSSSYKTSEKKGK